MKRLTVETPHQRQASENKRKLSLHPQNSHLLPVTTVHIPQLAYGTSMRRHYSSAHCILMYQQWAVRTRCHQIHPPHLHWTDSEQAPSDWRLTVCDERALAGSDVTQCRSRIAGSGTPGTGAYSYKESTTGHKASVQHLVFHDREQAMTYLCMVARVM